MKEATREHLAHAAREKAQVPFHGAADGQASNLAPIVAPFPTWKVEEADGLWCAAFVYYCCREAGFDLPIRPKECRSCHLAGCIAWEEWALGDPRIEYHRGDGFTPEPGDIVLYDQLVCIPNNGRKEPIYEINVNGRDVNLNDYPNEQLPIVAHKIPGFESCHIISTGPHIGIRESRKIHGIYMLTAEDLLSNRMFEDAIAMGGYPIDIHSPDGSDMKHCHLKPGSWYSVPYRSLVTEEIANLIVAGRCISATHEACAAVRVTPIAMAIGQAAGTAAAQSVVTCEPANKLNTRALRESLVQNNAFLENYIG